MGATWATVSARGHQVVAQTLVPAWSLPSEEHGGFRERAWWVGDRVTLLGHHAGPSTLHPLPLLSASTASQKAVLAARLCSQSLKVPDASWLCGWLILTTMRTVLLPAVN